MNNTITYKIVKQKMDAVANSSFLNNLFETTTNVYMLIIANIYHADCPILDRPKKERNISETSIGLIKIILKIM